MTAYFKGQGEHLPLVKCWCENMFKDAQFPSLRAASVTMRVHSALETSSLIQSVSIRVMEGLQLG